MSKRMNVLVACEESQAVTIEMRRLGHRAFSCDIQECSGGHPEWHICGDALPLINGRCEFTTMDGKTHRIDGTWDLLIAHPPCTYLTLSGNRWYNVERYGPKAAKRIISRERAVAFFMSFMNADCLRIAIENPIGIMSSRFRKANQIVQPWQFALTEEEKTEKSTCLWLKGLPPLYQPAPRSRSWSITNGQRRTGSESGKPYGTTAPDAFLMQIGQRLRARPSPVSLGLLPSNGLVR